MKILLVCHFGTGKIMEKKKKNISGKKKRRQNEEDDIAALKEKIRHQKDALNKIIKKYSEKE